MSLFCFWLFLRDYLLIDRQAIHSHNILLMVLLLLGLVMKLQLGVLLTIIVILRYINAFVIIIILDKLECLLSLRWSRWEVIDNELLANGAAINTVSKINFCT
jgi:hypothetical protein